MNIRVIIADDHPVVRVAARLALEKANMIVAGEAANATELHALMASTPCDVVVTDLTMPNDLTSDGVALIQYLVSHYPSSRIVVFTSSQTTSVLQTLFSIGVYGIIEKSAPVAELPTAVLQALAGRRYIGLTLKDLLAEAGTLRPKASKTPTLSPRELDIARLLASGFSNIQIAARLGVSHKTVSRHKREAMLKLSAKSDSELFDAMTRLGLRN